MDLLTPPYGGALCRQLADPRGVERLKGPKEEACEARAVVFSPRQFSDLNLLLNGEFSLLRGFLGCADCESVSDTLRLESGLLGSIPVALDVPDAAAATAEGLYADDRLALQDPECLIHALLTIGDVWRPDKHYEAEAVYGIVSDAHPGVRYRYEQVHETCRAIEGIEPPSHYDFENLWGSLEKLRLLITALDAWSPGILEAARVD